MAGKVRKSLRKRVPSKGSKPKTHKVDHIIVGSSPVCLMEAVWQTKQGKSVLVLDGASQIGGAWKDIELFGCDRVEISTHIMRHYRRGYKFLSDKLGIKLEPMKPEPFWLLRRYPLVPRRTGYSRHWNLTLYPTIGTLLSSEGFLRALQSPKARLAAPLFSSMIIFWRYLKRGSMRAYYPVGGAPAFIRQIETLARDAGVTIHLNTQMDAVKLTKDKSRVNVHIADGHVYECKKLTITRQTKIAEIRTPDGTIPVESNPNDTHHIHMLVADGTPRRFSLVRFRNNSDFEMMSDISRFSDSFTQKHPERKLIAAWWRSHRLPKKSDIVGEFQKLLDEGLLPKSSKLEKFNISTYPAIEILDRSIQQINASFNGVIQVLETDNLTQNIDQYAKRWSNIT